MSFRPGDTVLVESTGKIGTAGSIKDDEVVVKNGDIERVNKNDVVAVSEHLRRDRWMQEVGNTDASEILQSWNNAEVVEPPHGLDADEVRYVRSEQLVLLRKDVELVTAISTKTCKTELQNAIDRVE